MADQVSLAMGVCKICAAERREIFSGLILGKYKVRYLACDGCGLLQTEEPYWLDESYTEPIAATDTGIVSRNLGAATRIAPVLGAIFPRGRYLDAGAGYGLFVRQMRDMGLDFRWDDPHCPNLFARGFERGPRDRFDVVTAIEVAEHLADPVRWFSSILENSGAKTIIFTTCLFEGTPDPGWWYLSQETGQHISFYERRTLQALGATLNLRSFSSGMIHMFTDRPTSERQFAALTSRLGRLAWRLQRRGLSSLVAADHETMRQSLVDATSLGQADERSQ